MKQIRSLILLALLCALPAVFTGCSTNSVGIGLKTSEGVDITVTAAMTAWGDYVAANHPPVSQEIQVKAAFDKYRSAQLVVVDALQSLNTLSGTNATAGQSALDSATAAVASSLNDLVSLVRQFGVKI